MTQTARPHHAPWLALAVLGAVLGACGSDPQATPPKPPPASMEPSPDSAEAPPTPAAPAPSPTRQEPPEEVPSPTPVIDLDRSASTSIGSPTFGRIEGAVLLPTEIAGITSLPKKDPQSRYGTAELVGGLIRAAAVVAEQSPGPPISIGDLSRQEGGPISGHASHRSGRDVDVLFPLLRDSGEPLSPSKFIPLDPDGRGTDYGDLADPDDDVPVTLDVDRTWRFVAALLADEHATVQRILVVEHLRTRLLEHARNNDAPANIVERFAQVTCQPRFPHDDHMHIRVFCSAEDIGRGCEDTTPVFPWRNKQLKAEGVAVTPAGTGPDSKAIAAAQADARPKLKTLAQARAEAGPMHQDVTDFLERREAWARKPHPGRRYCR